MFGTGKGPKNCGSRNVTICLRPLKNLELKVATEGKAECAQSFCVFREIKDCLSLFVLALQVSFALLLLFRAWFARCSLLIFGSVAFLSFPVFLHNMCFLHCFGNVLLSAFVFLAACSALRWFCRLVLPLVCWTCWFLSSTSSRLPAVFWFVFVMFCLVRCACWFSCFNRCSPCIDGSVRLSPLVPQQYGISSVVCSWLVCAQFWLFIR